MALFVANQATLDQTQGQSALGQLGVAAEWPQWDGAGSGVGVSGEGFGLEAVELGLVDRARIQQFLGPGDLLGGGRGGVTGSGD